MYLLNLVKLASFYLKSYVPDNSDILNICIDQYQSKNSIKQVNAYIEFINQSHDNFYQNTSPPINVVKPFIKLSLSIDAWWSGVDFNILENKVYLDALIYIIYSAENTHIIAASTINEEEYHHLQQSLYNFAKAFLIYQKRQTNASVYSIELFNMWQQI